MLSHFILFIIHSWIETPSPRISGLSNGSFNPKDARDAILTVGHWSWVVVWLWWGWVQPGRPARPQVPDHITAAGRPPPRQTQNPDIKICTLKRYKQHFSTGVMNRLNCQKVGRRNISFFIQIYIPDPDRTGWKSDFQNFSAPYVVGCLSRGIDGISSKQLTDLKFIKPVRR